MNQQKQILQEKKPWAIISVFKEDTNPNDIQRISPLIQSLVDEWQTKGKVMWSGPFNDNATGMAIFEATEAEAREFYNKYDRICSGILDYSMYQWDAMPLLSFLSQE